MALCVSYIYIYFICRELFSNVATGINFEKYDDIPVEASGETPPECISNVSNVCTEMSVADLNLQLLINNQQDPWMTHS